MSGRGQMIPKGNGKWLLRIYSGRNAEGKRQYDSKMFEGTTTQARQELTKMHHQLDTQTLVRPTKETLRAFATRWLKGRLDIAPGTRGDYQKQLDSYILPALGHKTLTEITLVAVQEFYGQLVDQGLSPRSIRYVHTVLNQVFNLAITQGFLLRNPAHKANLPKRVKRPATVLDAKAINGFLEHSKADPLHALWRLLLTSGFRTQEALALKWSDLTVSGKEVSAHMRRTLIRDGEGFYSVAELEGKTAEAVRAVSLPWSTYEALKVHQRRQSAEILLAGAQYARQEFVFATRVGGFLDPNWVRRKWKTALKAAGLPTIRLYDTRHSHATALLTQGVNLKWVSERLGHADTKITEDIYAHVLPAAHREMADVMETILQSGT
jgi:integrase